MDIYSKRICVATYTDEKYLERAKITIDEVRSNGRYYGDFVVMTDGLFKFDDRYIKKYNLIIKEYPDIDTSELVKKIKAHPFRCNDGREYYKLKQWNKFYAFDTYFKQWDYILFVDAGLRVFNSLEYFYPQFKANCLTALDDRHPDFTKLFTETQIEMSNVEVVNEFSKVFNIHGPWFLNCIFLYDTNIIKENTVETLINMMNKYPICKTNEMVIMNAYFKDVWNPMQVYLRDGLVLFDWCERDGKNYRNYVALKYPRTK